MSRPAPQVLVAQALGRTDYDIAILASPGFWIVTYQGQPFSFTRTHRYSGRVVYPNTGYAHPAHAERLAHKLNRIFATKDFDIAKVA